MERFNKETMSVSSEEYDYLIKKEIEVWSSYAKENPSVSKFSEMKETLPYLTYRKNTIEKEISFVKNLGEQVEILELGSADGWLTNELLSLLNVRGVTSIDIAVNEDMIKKYAGTQKDILQGDLNKIEQIKFVKKYDCIITHGTLHHLVDPKSVIEFCIENLLKSKGIFIINDTWVHQGLQLKINALAYISLNSIPKAFFKFKVRTFLSLLKKAFMICFSDQYACEIAHAHNISPFESISSADDYKSVYERADIEILYFRNFAALPGLQNSWSSSPKFVKDLIQFFDEILIKKKILLGDVHVCVFRKRQ